MKITVDNAPEEYFNAKFYVDGIEYFAPVELDEKEGYLIYLEKDVNGNFMLNDYATEVKTIKVFGAVRVEFLEGGIE